MTTENNISHYTTLSGFKSIIESSVLWATNINFLNDEKEYLHAFDIVKEELENFYNEIGALSEENKFFMATTNKAIENLYKEGSAQHYTISFSSEKDQLSQWRAYGQVGIVFNRKKFTEEMESEHGFPIKISDCEYSEDKLSANIKNEIKKIFNEYINCSDTEKKNKIRLLLLDIQSDLYGIAAFYKHNGFKEEREIRLTYATNDERETSFRTSSSCLIPYIPIAFEKSSIDSIIIGPCIDPTRMEKSLSLFIDKEFSGKHKPEITHSRIPYRNW